MMADLILQPIGFFHCPSQTEPYQAGRQPDQLGETGLVELLAKHNYEQALQDIEGCSHLWLIFGFHKNHSWKPLVQTPRSDKKIGVFATRAPYRPNPIGLSVVQLLKVSGLTLSVGASDLLDGSPIYDIKPYHPEVDKIDSASVDWLIDSVGTKYNITFSPAANETFEIISSLGVEGKVVATQIQDFILRQLEYDPTNTRKKRVQAQLGFFTLSYRTFRIDFTLTENIVAILSIYSGYTSTELESEDDPYSDKVIHRRITSGI